MTDCRTSFGITKAGAASLYTLHSGNMTAAFTDFGAALVSLTVPDRRGNPTDVVLGYDTAAEYETGGCFFGASIGRVGNRIGGASFSLNEKVYCLDANENGNCLHGGFSGYDKRLWTVLAVSEKEDSITFGIKSPDEDQGMPGNLDLCVTYTLVSDANGCSLKLHYQAVSDRDTLLNPTNHSYFNLNGHNSGSILGHTLQIHADLFTAVQDSACIPLENKDVTGTPFDFRNPKPIGQDIDLADCRQLEYGRGYDHNYVISRQRGTMQTMAAATGDKTGISMTVLSDMPAVQFYAGNQITRQKGKGDAVYDFRGGFCLETQYIPDSIHHPEFALPCILKAGETFDSVTVYRFTP